MGVKDTEYSPDMLVDLLPQYYKRLFPFAQYTKYVHLSMSPSWEKSFFI